MNDNSIYEEAKKLLMTRYDAENHQPMSDIEERVRMHWCKPTDPAELRELARKRYEEALRAAELLETLKLG